MVEIRNGHQCLPHFQTSCVVKISITNHGNENPLIMILKRHRSPNSQEETVTLLENEQTTK